MCACQKVKIEERTYFNVRWVRKDSKDNNKLLLWKGDLNGFLKSLKIYRRKVLFG